MSEKEVWKPIPGFEGFYSASSLGRVKSEDRVVKGKGGKRKIKGRVLIQSKDEVHGRLFVHLWEGNKKKNFYVHRCVLLAFVSDKPDGLEASHLDGDPSNNNISNLVWETHSQNLGRKIFHGTDQNGERNPYAKLTEKDVLMIRKSDKSVKQLTAELNVSYSAIRNVRIRKTWEWLNE